MVKRVRITENFSVGSLLFARVDWRRHCYRIGLLNRDKRIQTQ